MVRNDVRGGHEFNVREEWGERGRRVEGVTTRGMWEGRLRWVRGINGKVGASHVEVEAYTQAKLSEVQLLSTKLGGLEALKAFYARLAKEGLGTERIEQMASST